MAGPLLVTGASGRLGRLVVEALLARGGHHVIATTRQTQAIADLAGRGVEVRFADHDRPETLAEAYRGAARMLVISSFSIGRRADQMRPVIAAAKAAGVGHICYTSGTGARPSADRVTDDHFWSEAIIQASGVPWTFLRHNMYAEHATMAVAAGIVSGTIASPIGDQGRGYVTRADCAAADAGALSDGFDGCRIVDVTGPAVVGHAELAEIATRLSGRPVDYVPVARAAAVQAWAAAGLPGFIAPALADYDLFAGEGHHALATRAMAELGGREPESVAAFLTRNRAAVMPGPDGLIDMAAIERL